MNKQICKFLAVFLSVWIFVISFLGLSAYADEEPTELTPTFHGYEILGYDIEGNVILSNDDYLEYFDSCIAERIAMSEAGMELPAIEEPAPISGYGIQTYDFLDALDEVKFVENTRFLPKPSFWDVAFDTAMYFLKHPTISAGTPVPEDSFTGKISSVGKRRIYYSKADLYENITCSISASGGECTAYFMRSGLGTSSTFTIYSQESTNISITWKDDGYSLYSSQNSGTDPAFGSTTQLGIYMKSYSVNTLPYYTASTTGVLSPVSTYIKGGGNVTAAYAESVFSTNDSTYQANHTLVTSSKKYWNPCTIYNNIYPIKSGDVINQNNVNNYVELGYYWDSTTNSLGLDMDVLAAYIENTLIPQMWAIYKDAYWEFPDIGADINDTDITYVNPFGDDDDTSNLPDTTNSGGGGGGMTPAELDGVLNSETFYILDMETDFPEVALGTLPAVQDFSPDIVSAASGVSEFVVQLFSVVGVLPLFGTLSVLAFVVFVLVG